MKPRRWYSSPERNPHPTPPAVRPQLTAIYLRCAELVLPEQGPVIRRQATADQGRGAAPARPPRPPRLIEAA